MQYRNTVRITNKTYNDFFVADALDSLAYYCQLKSLHKHPIFYSKGNVKRDCAKALNVSYNAMKYHLGVIESLGYLEYIKTNLLLKTNNPKTTPNSESSKRD